MIAEILSTGDEIRSGAVIDSNSAYIAEKLEEAGVTVLRHGCVGDDMDLMVSVISEISERAEIAIVTGGLGPTEDDITALAAARAAGVELQLDREAFESLENFFKSRNFPVTASNRKQALLPAGAECLINPVGTAPGFCVKKKKCSLFFLPGVPLEMKRMMTEQVIPRIEKLQGDGKMFSRISNISTFGMTEAAVNDRLSGLDSGFATIRLGLRAVFPEIHVKLYGYSYDPVVLEEEMETACGMVREKLGDNVFSVDGHTLEEEVGRLLSLEKSTVAVAESCTGGMVADRLTNVPGSSDYFLFSGVTYSNRSKIKVLGVSPDTLDKYGAVDEQTVKEMAEGVKNLFGAVYGLSTSGIAGPDGGTEEKPVGTVCIGISTPRETEGYRLYFPFPERIQNKNIFATMALDILRRKLISGE